MPTQGRVLALVLRLPSTRSWPRNHPFGGCARVLHRAPLWQVKPFLGEWKEGAVQENGHRYEVDIFWSDEDGCFIACVPDLDNCAAWGMTYEEALAQVHEAIRADLASRQRVGDPIPTATPRVLA